MDFLKKYFSSCHLILLLQATIYMGDKLLYMKNEQYPASAEMRQHNYDISNTLMMIILLLVPFLYRPVSGPYEAGHSFSEKQVGVKEVPLTDGKMRTEEIVGIGYVSLLLLLLISVRRMERKLEKEEQHRIAMFMEDEEVLAAWEQVRKRLSDDGNA